MTAATSVKAAAPVEASATSVKASTTMGTPTEARLPARRESSRDAPVIKAAECA